MRAPSCSVPHLYYPYPNHIIQEMKQCQLIFDFKDWLRYEAEEIVKKMTYVEFSASRRVMDEYVSAQFLLHNYINVFPTVKKGLT
jgi:hypothetical protein